jgi:thioredoxin 1
MEGKLTGTHPQAVSDATFGPEVEQHKGLVLVDFWATWCGPCHMVAPVLEQLATEHAGKVKVAKLDVDENPQTAMRFNVRSIPTVLFFKDGQKVDQLVGAYQKPVFEERIQKHL